MDYSVAFRPKVIFDPVSFSGGGGGGEGTQLAARKPDEFRKVPRGTSPIVALHLSGSLLST